MSDSEFKKDRMSLITGSTNLESIVDADVSSRSCI